MTAVRARFQPSQPDPRLNRLLAGYPADLFTERLYQSDELAQCYGVEITRRLLQQLGIAALLAQGPCSLLTIQQQLAFSPKFQPALDWLLHYADSERLLTRSLDASGQPMHCLGPAWSPPATDTLTELRAVGAGIDPGNAATLDLLDAAAEAWLQLATDEASGTEALLGMGQLHLWLSYFNAQNPLYAANNRLAALAAVRCLQNNLQDSACPPPWRLLEVGAGAGSGAQALLHALAEADLLQHIALYRITEPNAFFRRRAERELKARYPELTLEFGSLNIDQPWQEQGLAGQSPTEQSRGGQGFDLIYCVNVLHVAKDLQFSLAQAAQWLKPAGWLVSGECLRPLPDQPVYTELMFRILDSYTQVTLDPAFRPNPGFLTAQQWRTALRAAGLDQIRIEPDHELIRAVYPRFLLGALCAQPMRSG